MMIRRHPVLAMTFCVLTTFAIGCGKAKPDEKLVKDVTTLMPKEPEAPLTYKLAPAGSMVVYGDEYVVAATLELAAGDVIPDHDITGSTVLYALDDSVVKLDQDGEERLAELDRGEVLALEPGRYQIATPADGETTGSAELLFVTRTEVPLPDLAEPYAPFGPAELDDGTALYEDEWVRVIDLQINAGTATALDVVPYRLVVSPDATVELSLASEAEDGSPLTLDAGEADGRTPPEVKLENLGGEPAHVVLFEYRK